MTTLTICIILIIDGARLGRSARFWYWERDGARYAVRDADVLGWRYHDMEE